jgi:hypothetical protein
MKKILLIVSLFAITGVGFSKVIISQINNSTSITIGEEEDEKGKKKSAKKSCCAAKAGAEGKACAGMMKDEASTNAAPASKAEGTESCSKKASKSCCKKEASNTDKKSEKAEAAL